MRTSKKNIRKDFMEGFKGVNINGKCLCHWQYWIYICHLTLCHMSNDTFSFREWPMEKTILKSLEWQRSISNHLYWKQSEMRCVLVKLGLFLWVRSNLVLLFYEPTVYARQEKILTTKIFLTIFSFLTRQGNKESYIWLGRRMERGHFSPAKSLRTQIQSKNSTETHIKFNTLPKES